MGREQVIIVMQNRRMLRTRGDEWIETRRASHGATAVLIEAQHRAELAEQRLAMLTLVLDDLRVQRDKWQQQAERLAITDKRARQPWWRRLAA